MKSRRFSTNTEHGWFVSLLYLVAILSSFSFFSLPSFLHVSTSCYLFLPYRHDFSYSLFPPNLIRYFCFSSHEIACVHTFFELFKYFFPPFPPLYSFFFFFWVNQVKGISITDPSADPLTFCVYILSFSLVLVAISDSNLGLKSSYRFNCVHRLSGFGFGSDSYRRVFCRFFTFVDLYTEEGNPSNCWIFLIRLG